MRPLAPDVRREYIDGELVMTPAPTQPHQKIARRLANLIEGAMPDGVEVIEGWGWKPRPDQFVPDFMVYDATDAPLRLTGVPHLVVEILSTDPTADMIRKAAKYAAAGLQRYWIIDPAEPTVIVYSLVDGVLVDEGRHENRSPSIPVWRTSPSTPIAADSKPSGHGRTRIQDPTADRGPTWARGAPSPGD